MTKRLDPKDRRAEILDAALRMSRLHGYREVTRADIAGAAKCSEALVSSYWGTMVQMRRAIVRAAIDRRDLTLVAQAIVATDKHAAKLTAELRQTALLSLA
jgi:AcrR family transcriptional regulator